MKLQAKILIFILTATILIFSSIIGFVSIKSKNKTIEDAKKLTDAYARENANLVAGTLSEDIDLSRTLAQVFMNMQQIDQDKRLAIYDEYLINIYNENPGYLAVWASWELSEWDTAYTKNHGRLSAEAFIKFGKTQINHQYKNMDADIPGSEYYKSKTSKKEGLTNPYMYSYEGDSEQMLVASVDAPILKDGKFIGLAGVDISMQKFQDLTDAIKPFKNSYAFFITYNGIIVAHKNEKYINETLKTVDFKTTSENNVMERVQAGEAFSFERETEDGVEYVSFAPVKVGRTSEPWAIAVVVPLKVIAEKANKDLYQSLFFGLIGLVILSIIILIITRYITKPLMRITEILKSLAKGEVDASYKVNVRSKDEIGEIRKSVNTLLDGLLSTAKFAENIGQGNLDADFKLLSNNDVLGKSLLEMRKSLKQAKKEEQERKKIDKQVSWATAGMAKFGTILRNESNGIEDLSFNIISNLVNYLEAIQGGVFIYNNEDPDSAFYLMTAAYAYHRKRFAEKKILDREGLVGRCGFEKQSIYLEDIPDEHVTITSGLGDSNPRSLLLVPLLLNEEIFGVIEIASYNKFEKYQIEFTEKVGEIIASTISSVRTNLKTARLLAQSQEQAEEMASQEEELRQNMEELQATQEEMERKNKEKEEQLKKLNESYEGKIEELALSSLDSKAILEALNETTYLVEYDFSGNIIYANQFVARIFNTTVEQIIGTKHSDNLQGNSQKSSAEYSQFWFDLKAGKRILEENLYYSNGRDMWLAEKYVPIFDKDGTPYKVLKIAHDITAEKQAKKIMDAEKEKQKEEISEIYLQNSLKEQKLLEKIKELENEIDKLNKNK